MTPKYSDEKFWFEHASQFKGKSIDIFYVYPTINSEPLTNRGNVPAYTDIKKAEIRNAARKTQTYNKIVYAADDFNFYAPYYRQMTTKVFAMSNTERKERARLSTSDVKRAFQYYMREYNNGRPYILLSHSQGSQMVLELLKHGMTDKQFNQMIAAYLMGYEITEKELKKFPNRLKPATGEYDRGVIISYNSATSVNAKSPLLANSVVCINPLNWKTDSSIAPASLHKGIIRYDKTIKGYKTTPHFTSVQIQDNTLICLDVKPDLCYNEELKDPFPLGNLHFADTWLYAENIKENMRKRSGLLK
jgi:hypothetical protein